MWGRRVAYLLTLVGSAVFYVFYREWFSWLLLLCTLLLPWFSLAVSLPAMLTTHTGLRCPETVRMEVPVRTALQVECKFPVPPLRSRIRLHNRLTDRRYVGKPGERIPTEHCGCMRISYAQMFVYDYLGLFRRRLRQGDSTDVYILPKPVPAQLPEQLQPRPVSLWRPKPGGGFSENHDLRDYRPGDELRGIHWKMTAKTGKLIYREPIEPVQKGYLLTLTLCGDAGVLDQKLGQLLWMSQSLLERGISHEVLCQTADGQLRYGVEDAASLQTGLQQLLGCRPALREQKLTRQDVLWQHHIGGDDDEG